MTDCFNSEPILLRNPTSLLVAEENLKDEQIIEVTQHLAPEQFQYEFPPKSRIMAIEAEVDDNDQFSYFDECSFTTTSTSTAAYSNITYGHDDEEGDDEDYYHQLMNNNSNRSSSDRLDRYFESFTNEHGGNLFISDNQLSPLQLPTQMSQSMRRIREESYDSTGTVVLEKHSTGGYSRPSSFLSESEHHRHLSLVAEEDRINWDEKSFIFPDDQSHYDHENVYQSIHPYRLDSTSDIYLHDDLSGDDLLSDEGSRFSNNSRVIVMKISKHHPPTVIQSTGGSFISTTDEGYDDEEFEGDCKELPIESASVFLPLSDNEQELLLDIELVRHSAAIKIQSLWRGYMGRKHTKITSHRVMAGLARINDSIHCRNNNQLQDRCYELEQRLGEETAMRIAFEKAMEDMTILMDHQHKVLHERVEQEVNMRNAYERKMEQVISQVQPLESRLRHESKARADMESMMSRVLDQLHDVKAQQKEDLEQRKSMQRKLDDAMKEIDLLKKKQPSHVTTTVRPSSTTRTGVTTPSAQRSISRLSSTSTSSRNSSPVKRSKVTPPVTLASKSRVTVRSTTVKTPTPTIRTTSRLSTTPVTATKDINKRPTTTPLRKTVINRKL